MTSGVVDQDIDLPQRPLGGGEGVRRRPGIQQIAGNRRHLALARRVYFRFRLVQNILTPSQDRHIGARAGEFNRHALTEPVAAAGDQGGLSVQSDVHDEALPGIENVGDDGRLV